MGAYTQILNAILLIGTTLLVLGTACLVTVRLANPRLRGLGWLGGGFAAGGAGALLLLQTGRVSPFVSGPCSDMAILLAFVLVHAAALDLMQDKSRMPWFGAGLLAAEAATQVFLTLTHGSGRVRVVMIGLLVGAQVLQTFGLLARRARVGMRASVWFTAMVLAGFGAMNLLCSVMFAFDFVSPVVSHQIEIISFVGYIASALGIAFGFFWMTTAQLSAELEYMASTDPLTRVYNRRGFRDWCEREIARSRRTGTTFSLLMIDVDHFKRINDRFGHSVGDVVLCEVVEQLQDSVRGIDVLGRWGGEEFMALLPGANAEAAFLVAERVRGNVEKLRLPKLLPGLAVGELPDGLTVSLGVASWAGGADRVEAILDRADRALYRAKAEGRNRVLVSKSGPRAIYSASC